MFKRLHEFLLHPQSRIVGIGFFTLSLLMGTWGTRLPQLKISLGINDGQLSLALLLFSIGSLIISPVSSYIMDRYPTGKATYISVILLTFLYILPFLAPNYGSFLISMVIVGIANGFLNVTINASAAIVEIKHQRSIMSSCHGMFSIGIIIGSISAGVIASTGLAPIYHMGGLIIVLLIFNFLLKKTWFSIPTTNLKAPFFVLPKGPVVVFALIAFCIVLAELTILDWSAVYLKESLNSGVTISGFGLAGFSVTMAIGRLSGDAIIPKIGKRKIIFIGCILASIGLSLAAFTSNPVLAIIGFTICGSGMAVTVPLLYSLSAQVDGVSSGIGIASIATACILGGLFSRPMVGWVSEIAGMSTSIWIAAGFAFIASLFSLLMKK